MTGNSSAYGPAEARHSCRAMLSDCAEAEAELADKNVGPTDKRTDAAGESGYCLDTGVVRGYNDWRRLAGMSRVWPASLDKIVFALAHAARTRS